MSIIKQTAFDGISIKYEPGDHMWLMNVEDNLRMLDSNGHSRSLLQAFSGLAPEVSIQGNNAVVQIERPMKNEFNMPGFSTTRVLKTGNTAIVLQTFQEKVEHNGWRKGNSRLQIAHDTKICCSALDEVAAQTQGRGSASYVRFSNHELLMSNGSWMRSYIGLAHELIHALHNARGEQQIPYLTEEHRTVGINGFEDEALTENSVRRRFGLPKRVAY